MKIGFFGLDEWQKKLAKQKLSAHELLFIPRPLTEAEVADFSDLEIIAVRATSKIDPKILSKLPNLKFIAAISTGIDNIDLHAAETNNILVSNVPSYGEETVAEYTFALILALSRRIVEAVHKVRERHGFSNDDLQGFDLQEKVLGVIGTGHIGKNVIRIANGFQMKVVAFDAFPQKELETQLNFKYMDLVTLLNSADIVTLHVPYLPQTHHLINSANIKEFRPGAMLINTSRGAVVQTEALIEALKSGLLSSAGLDVLEYEDKLTDEWLFAKVKDAQTKSAFKNLEKLTHMDNVIVTPHNAFNSYEAKERMLLVTIDNILKFIQERMQNLVKA